MNLTPQDILPLERSALFKNIPSDLARELLPHFQARSVEPEEVVFAQGESGDALVVLLSGSYELIRSGSTGDVHLTDLEPGTVLGHVSLVDSGTRSATLRACSPGRIASMDRHTFDQLWQDPSPQTVQLQLRVVQLIIEELRNANRRLAGLLDVPMSDAPEAIQRLMGVMDKVRERAVTR